MDYISQLRNCQAPFKNYAMAIEWMKFFLALTRTLEDRILPLSFKIQPECYTACAQEMFLKTTKILWNSYCSSWLPFESNDSSSSDKVVLLPLSKLLVYFLKKIDLSNFRKTVKRVVLPDKSAHNVLNFEIERINNILSALYSCSKTEKYLSIVWQYGLDKS